MYRRILKTLSVLLLGTGQEVLFQLLGALLWISFWGVELYSEWLALSLLPMLLSRGSAGLFHVAASDMIAMTSVGNRAGAAHVLASLRAAQNWCIAAAAILFGVLASALYGLNDEPKFSATEVIVITILFVVQFSAFQWQQAELNILKAEGEAPRAVLWQLGFRSVFVVAMLTACVWLEPAACLAIGVILQVLVLIWTRVKLRTLRRSYTQIDHRPAGGEIRRLFWKGWQFSAFPIGQSVVHSAAVWSLGVTVSPIAGAAFHNMRTISRLLVLAARAAEQAVRLELSAIIGTHGLPAARVLVMKTIGLTIGAGAAMLIVVLTLGPSVFEWISQEHLPFDPIVFGLVSISALFFAVAQPFSAALFASNQHGRLADQYVPILIIVALLMIPLASFGSRPIATIILVADFALLALARQSFMRFTTAAPEQAPHVV